MSEQDTEYSSMGPLYSVWARTLSFLFGIFLSVVVLILPQIIAKDVSELNHNFLSLVMLAMSGCFVHGVGFIPNNIFARYLFSPYICWPIVVYAAYSWLA